jgi:hypothetical protein
MTDMLCEWHVADDDDDDDDDVTFVNIREHVLDDSDACGGLHIDVSIVFAQ